MKPVVADTHAILWYLSAHPKLSEKAKPAIELVPLSGEIAFAVHRIDRAVVPDFPDRIIAATALSLGLPLITCDEKIQRSGVPIIW